MIVDQMHVYVVWCLDGPIMTSLLNFPDTAAMREVMAQWSTEDYVRQAFDAEFPDAGGLQDDTYELAAIFEAKPVNFIY